MRPLVPQDGSCKPIFLNGVTRGPYNPHKSSYSPQVFSARSPKSWFSGEEYLFPKTNRYMFYLEQNHFRSLTCHHLLWCFGVWIPRMRQKNLLPFFGGTPPKFNKAPEKWWLAKYFPFGYILGFRLQPGVKKKEKKAPTLPCWMAGWRSSKILYGSHFQLIFYRVPKKNCPYQSITDLGGKKGDLSSAQISHVRIFFRFSGRPGDIDWQIALGRTRGDISFYSPSWESGGCLLSGNPACSQLHFEDLDQKNHASGAIDTRATYARVKVQFLACCPSNLYAIELQGMTQPRANHRLQVATCFFWKEVPIRLAFPSRSRLFFVP